MLTILFNILVSLLRLYGWVIFAAALFQTLLSFGVLDSRNRLVWRIGEILYRLTEPVLAPIRSVLPSFGGIDFSPWVAWLAINWVLLPVLARIYNALIFHSTAPLIY